MVGTPRSQDPLPEYVSPELVRLIAKNAPAELDFFVQYLKRPKQSSRSAPWKLHRNAREVQAERERETRAAAVEELLRGVKERNDWIVAKKGQGGCQSFSAQQSARSDLETLSSTRSSPPKRTSLLARERELRNVSLEGLESNVTRILGRDFCLTKHAERVHWPLPPEARHRSRDAEDFPYHGVRKRGFGTRQAQEELLPPSAKFKDFFIGKTVSRASSNSSDESLSPPARKQRLPLKKIVPRGWETFETDVQAEDRNSGCTSKLDIFSPSKPGASATIKGKVNAAWIPPGKPSTVSLRAFRPMGPHSSRPSSARLPVGNRPVSPAWVPPGQPSRRPVSAPSGPTVSKSAATKHGSAGKGNTSEVPEIFKRAWVHYKDSEDFEKTSSMLASVKPWRRGMSTRSNTPVKAETKQPGTCKRNDPTHEEKLAEVTKFMEAKQSQRRKDQRDMKRKAEEEVAARKEKERLLQLHHQAMLEMEAEQAKDKPLKVRPAWNPDFDAARADGIGPWASPEFNFQGHKKASPKVAMDQSSVAQVVADSNDGSRHVSDISTEEKDSVRSGNIHVVLRPKKRGKGKYRQRKAHKPTKPKDPFVGSKKRARWKNSTNMNQYGGKDALKRREMMKIYGVLQVQPNLPPLTDSTVISDKRQQREAIDIHKKQFLQSLQRGGKKGTSASKKKAPKGKAKSKRSGRKDETVRRPPPKTVTAISEFRREVTRGPQMSHASKKGNIQLTNLQAATYGREKPKAGDLEMPSSSRKRKEQPDAQDIRSQQREPMKSFTIPAAASAMKQRKLESPPLIYFSDQAQISEVTRPQSPFKQFPSTLRPSSPSNKSQPFEKGRKRISGGGFHFKAAHKPSPLTQKERMDVESTKAGVGPGHQQSRRVSTPSIRASYSALVIPQGPRCCASTTKQAFDLNELEQAGSPLLAPQRQSANQKSNAAAKLSLVSRRASKRSNAVIHSNSEDVSPSYHGSSLPTTRLSLSTPSSLLSDENWQNEKVCQDSNENGEILKKEVMQQKAKELGCNEKLPPPRDKFDKEWTLPRREDSFSIVNLYAKHKAQERNAQESKIAARTSGVRTDVSHPILQKRRASTVAHLDGRNISPTSSSEFKSYVAAHYGDNISKLSESETLLSEIMVEMSGKQRKPLLRKPATADFIRSIQMDLAKSNATTEGKETTSNGNTSTIPGLSRDNSKLRSTSLRGHNILATNRMEPQTVSKEHMRTMNTTAQTFRQPTAFEMQSTTNQSKPHSKIPELFVDGISVLSTSRACMREPYRDMFSYDDSEALALHKVRMQLRKEQRLVRKLRRMQKLDGGLQQRESDIRIMNDSMLKQHVRPEKVPEAVTVSASQRQSQGLPAGQKYLRPPNRRGAHVPKHPPRRRFKKTRLQQVKLDTKGGRIPGHGLTKPLSGVGAKNGQKSSVAHHKSLLEKKIQQLTTQISEVIEKRLSDDQPKCGITSRNVFEPNMSFMASTLDETKRKSISSAVKIISIEDVASDSSQGKGSAEPPKKYCAELEQSLSNRGGYSDSFLSEGSILEQDPSSRSPRLPYTTAKTRKDCITGNSNQTLKGRMQPECTKCPPDNIYPTNLQVIPGEEFELQKPTMKVEVPNQPAASVKTKAYTIWDAMHQTDIECASKDTSLAVRPRSCDETGSCLNPTRTSGLESSSLLAPSKISRSKSSSRIAQEGGKGNCQWNIIKETDTVEYKGKETLQIGSFHKTATMESDGSSLGTGIKGPNSFRIADGVLKAFEITGSKGKDPQNDMGIGHSFEQAAPEIEEDIMPLSDNEQDVQYEIVSDGLSTVELPSLHENSMEVGHLFLAHIPLKQTAVSSRGLGNAFQDPMRTSRLHGPAASALPFRESTVNKHFQLESVNHRMLSQTMKHGGEHTRLKMLEQEDISKSLDPVMENTSSATNIPLTIEPSEVDSFESIASEKVFCVQATSTIEAEDHLHCVSSQVRSVNTVSYTDTFSSRRPSTKQTANYRQDDDNESINSINSPFRTVDEHEQPEGVHETICHKEMTHSAIGDRQTESAPPQRMSQTIQNGNGTELLGQEDEEGTLSFRDVSDENLCLTLEVADDAGTLHYDTGAPESSADNYERSAVLSVSNASMDHAYCAGSNGSPQKAFANSNMILEVQQATETESEPIPHVKMYEGKEDADRDFLPDISVFSVPLTITQNKSPDTIATGIGENIDADGIPEDIICEDLDIGAEVSAISVHDDEDHNKFKNICIHNEEGSQNCESTTTMFWQEQEEVTSKPSDNTKGNISTCSDAAIPLTVYEQAKQTKIVMPQASSGVNELYKGWNGIDDEFSSSLMDMTKATSTDRAAVAKNSVEENQFGTNDELHEAFESRQSKLSTEKQGCDSVTHRQTDGLGSDTSYKFRKLNICDSMISSGTTCSLKTPDLLEAEKLQVTEETTKAKYNLLADLLTSAILDNMLQVELSDAVGQRSRTCLRVATRKQHDPVCNSLSPFNLRNQVKPEPTQNSRNGLSLPKERTSSSINLKGVKISNQAGVRPYQAWGQQTRRGSSEIEKCPPGSLSPSYAAEYIQNLLNSSSVQDAGPTANQKLIADIKVFKETDTNQTTGDRRHPESQYLYNKLLHDAVNDSLTASFNPMPQLTINALKPISACDALKTALASIMEDVELANTARSPGQARCLLQKQMLATCEEWDVSWLEANELLVNELADGILAEMVGIIVLDMPWRGTCIA